MTEATTNQPTPDETPATPTTDVATEPVAEIAAEPVAVIDAEPVTVMEAEPVAEVATEPEAEIAAEPVAVIDAEPEAEVGAAQKTEVGADQEAEVAAEPEPLELPAIASRLEVLAGDVAAADNKVTFLDKIRALRNAIVGFDPNDETNLIVERLHDVETQIMAQIEERIAAKEALVARSESLVDSQEWKATSEAFRELQEQLRAVGIAGREFDDPLWERFKTARTGFHDRRKSFFDERGKVWADNRAKKEILCEQAEELAAEEAFTDRSAIARSMMESWKAAGFAGREAEDLLWPRFRGALDAFYERRTSYYEANRQQKEVLAVRAEELTESTDWKTTGEAMRRMMEEWKSLGSASREHDDPLWARFRGAQQTFFQRRSSAFSEREASAKDNIDKKEAICAQAEEIAAREDLRGAIDEIIALQGEWRQIAYVPKDKADDLWQRFKSASDHVFATVDGQRVQRQRAREQGFVDAVSRRREQMQRLNESISNDEANINRWRDTISTLGGGPRADQIRAELENRVIEVLMRVREKQTRVADLDTELKEIEARTPR